MNSLRNAFKDLVARVRMVFKNIAVDKRKHLLAGALAGLLGAALGAALGVQMYVESLVHAAALGAVLLAAGAGALKELLDWASNLKYTADGDLAPHTVEWADFSYTVAGGLVVAVVVVLVF